MLKVLLVFGTRPEAIKLAPVFRELKRRSTEADLQVVVCVTAQHRQMLDQVLRLFDIVPDYDLDVMKGDQSPTQVASSILTGLDPILQKEQPDWVVVQGDTTTVTAAALVAFYARLKVAHVEAGLRTFDKWQPFPEEINRRIASVIADLHFAPTGTARRNLLQEGVSDKQILVTGNPVIDAIRWVAKQPPTREACALLERCLSSGEMEGQKKRLVLVTAHRRENFGSPLESICLALRDIAALYGRQVRIVYPVHLNPNVWHPVHQMLGDIPNIILVPPLDYLPLVYLMKHSYLVLTDSGGIQEEAPGLGLPVLVLREVTERPEAVEAGTVRLIGTNRARIVAETVHLFEDGQDYSRMACAANPYGDGHAAERIVKGLLGEVMESFGSAAVPSIADSKCPAGAVHEHLD